MSVKNFIPELWSRQLLTNFRKNLVFGSLINRNYEGEIRDAGDTVKITTPSAISVNAYSGTVTYETPVSTQQSLLIDQQRYWAFELDDVDQAQANVSLMQAYMAEAAYALANDVDAALAGLYTEAGSNTLTIDLTATSPRQNMYPVIVDAGRILDEANVPRTGRWAVLSPKGYAHVLKEAEFIQASDSAHATLLSGQVGSIAGFTVYVSNNLTLATSRKYLFGTNAAITVADQVTKTEALRRETAFKDAVRGLLVYGRKVVRPAALGVISATE
ncbi:MAG TPA: P22 phage major capsid protein family protein [Trueperaceae bacterium]|nr:P22 phage major capsid protein family protein [Trueperaceae bacterium]